MSSAEYCPLRIVLKNGQIRCFDPWFLAGIERPAGIVERFCKDVGTYPECPYYRARGAPQSKAV